MIARPYPSILAFMLGVFASNFAVAVEQDRFIETVAKKNEAGQVVNIRQLCLKDQGLKLDKDVVAVIDRADGKVMVDKGKGFSSSPAGTLLKEGDRVITLDDSFAEVVFFDCCRSSLKANNLITISANPGCKAAIVDAASATNVAAAPLHPASYIPPAAGLFILIKSISIE